MEGFSKPPLPPTPSLPSSLWCHNTNQKIRNPIGRAINGIPVTQEYYFESQQQHDVDLLAVSQAVVQKPAHVDLLKVPRAEVPDPAQDKKLKRILASREYSKKYHSKQQEHIEKMETEVKVRETEIAVLSPRVRFSTRANMLLRAENDLIKQQLKTCEGNLMTKQVEEENLHREADWYRNLYQLQQAEMAYNPLAESGYMALHPSAQSGYQKFDLNLEPCYQPFDPLAGLDSETVDFSQYDAPAEADQFSFELPGLGDQFTRDPAEVYGQFEEPIGFSEFTEEPAVVVRSHIKTNTGVGQVGDGDDYPSEGTNLDNSDDSQKAADLPPTS